jgi:AcrR family transcriptional regulator
MVRISKDPRERKKELVDAAEYLFETRGYDQTAVSDIVKAVNVSQGTFYYYFECKEDVLVAVLENQIAIMERDLIDIANKTELDEAQRLNSMINRFISLNASGKKILSLLHEQKNATMHRKLIRAEPFSRIAPLMAQVISEGVDKGRFQAEHPLETSFLLLMLVASALHMSYLSSKLFEDLKKGDSPTKAHSPKKSDYIQDNMRSALEDLLGRSLMVKDYRFSLQI